MTKIRKAAIQQQFNDLTGNQVATDGSFDTCAPVYEIAAKYTTFLIAATNSANGATIYTTQTDRDFYITYLNLAWTKDATADSTYAVVRVVQGGLTVRLAQLNAQSLTAGTQNLVINFPHPVRVDRGSIIGVLSAKTAGTHSMEYTLGGFYQ